MGQASATSWRDGSLKRISSFANRREVGAILAVIALVLVGTVIRADVFWRVDNAVSILRTTATVAIIGYGMTLLIVSGEFDLSVGSWMATTMAVAALLFLDGWPVLLVVTIILLLSAVYGLFQGLLVTKLGLPSLIVTIGTLTLLRGVLLVVLGGVTVTLSDPSALVYLGGTFDLPAGISFGLQRFPMQIVWMLALMVLGYYVLNKTAFGYRSQFTGGNQDSARRTGVKTDQVKIINFMLVAMLAAFAGMSQLAFTQAVGPLTGQGIELTVIAAVVIGGTNLFGGEGSMFGTFLGALVFAITQNVLVLAGLGTQLFQIISGIFIIAAVLIEVLSKEARLKVLLTHYFRPLRGVVTQPKDFFGYVKTDVQGIDKPLAFLSISTAFLTSFTIILLFLGGAVTPWEFTFLFINGGVSAFGTVPVVAFGFVAVLALLSAVFLHAVVKAIDSSRDFDTTLQAVIYSLAPSVFLFVPILLSGWGFIAPLVLGTAVIIALPILYLLYIGVCVLHDFSPREAWLSVGVATVAWILFLTYVTVQSPIA